MAVSHLETACPSWLEDECFLIETSGEMPEVALQEALLNLPPLEPSELDCLRSAVALGYLRIIHRDLDHDNLGLPHFRGLERAEANLSRLLAFLKRLDWRLPAATKLELERRLLAFLEVEDKCLADGRPYASCAAEPLTALLAALALPPEPWQALLGRMRTLPVPDFKGLTALRRLDVPGAAFKRRDQREGAVVIAVLEAGGAVLAEVALSLKGPGDGEDPEARARAELVWSLTALPVA